MSPDLMLMLVIVLILVTRHITWAYILGWKFSCSTYQRLQLVSGVWGCLLNSVIRRVVTRRDSLVHALSICLTRRLRSGPLSYLSFDTIGGGHVLSWIVMGFSWGAWELTWLYCTLIHRIVFKETFIFVLDVCCVGSLILQQNLRLRTSRLHYSATVSNLEANSVLKHRSAEDRFNYSANLVYDLQTRWVVKRMFY